MKLRKLFTKYFMNTTTKSKNHKIQNQLIIIQIFSIFFLIASTILLILPQIAN